MGRRRVASPSRIKQLTALAPRYCRVAAKPADALARGRAKGEQRRELFSDARRSIAAGAISMLVSMTSVIPAVLNRNVPRALRAALHCCRAACALGTLLWSAVQCARMPKLHRCVLCAAVVACAAARRLARASSNSRERLPRRTRRAAETVVLDMPLGLLESRVERQLSKALGQAPVEHGAFQALRMVCGFALLFQSAKIPQTAATLQCFACLLQISHGLILGATGGGIDLFQSPARDDEGARVLFVVVRLCAWIVARDIAERHGTTAAIAGVTIGVLAAKLAVATYDHARILARRQRKRIQAVRGLAVADEHEPPLDAIAATLERLEMSYSDYVKQGLNWVVRTQVYAERARRPRRRLHGVRRGAY